MLSIATALRRVQAIGHAPPPCRQGGRSRTFALTTALVFGYAASRWNAHRDPQRCRTVRLGPKVMRKRSEMTVSECNSSFDAALPHLKGKLTGFVARLTAPLGAADRLAAQGGRMPCPGVEKGRHRCAAVGLEYAQ